jgi:hypothetical protein
VYRFFSQQAVIEWFFFSPRVDGVDLDGVFVPGDLGVRVAHGLARKADRLTKLCHCVQADVVGQDGPLCSLVEKKMGEKNEQV